jgi:hypothetical protein
MTDVSILGGDAVRGNPDGMFSVARLLSETAGEIDAVRASLMRAGTTGFWHGAAAEAFHLLVSRTPDDLAKASRSYAYAAETVTSYASQLRASHDRAQWLANQIGALQGQMGGSDAVVRADQNAVNDARRALSRAPANQRAQAQRVLDQRLRALASAAAGRADLQHRIDDLHRQAADNRHALDRAADRARDQMHEASKEGMRNSVASLLHRAGDALHGISSEAKQLLLVVGKILKEAADLPGAVMAFIADPSSAGLSRILKDVNSVLMIVGTVVLVAGLVLATIFSGGTAGVALIALAGTIGTASRFVSAAELGVDLERKYVEHDKDVSTIDLIFDAAAVVTPSSTLKGEVGVTQALGDVGRYYVPAADLHKRFVKMVVEDALKEGARDRAKSLLEHQVKDFMKDRPDLFAPDPVLKLDPLLPVRPPLLPLLHDLLRTPLTVVKHKVTVTIPQITIPTPLVQETR